MLRRNSENKIWKQIPFFGVISELIIPNPDHQWVGELQAGLKIRPRVIITQSCVIYTNYLLVLIVVIVVLVCGDSTVSTSRKCHLSCYHCSNLQRQELQFILFIPFALYLCHLSCIVPILGGGNWGARRKPDLSCKQEQNKCVKLQTRACRVKAGFSLLLTSLQYL